MIPPKLKERISELFPAKGSCLIPKESSITRDSTLLSCHEHDFCRCDIDKIATELWEEILMLRGALEYYSSGKIMFVTGEINTGLAKQALTKSTEKWGE